MVVTDRANRTAGGRTTVWGACGIALGRAVPVAWATRGRNRHERKKTSISRAMLNECAPVWGTGWHAGDGKDVRPVGTWGRGKGMQRWEKTTTDGTNVADAK